MKIKNFNIFISILLLIVMYLFIGCSNQEEKDNSTDNVLENLDINVKEIEKDIEYKLTKLNLYSEINLDEDNYEYIVIYSADKDKVYFTVEKARKDLGTGRDITLKIGIYDMVIGSIEFIKEFDYTVFVNDIISNINGEIIYSYYVDGDDFKMNWYINQISDSGETVIDEGLSIWVVPRLGKIGDRILYLYERVNNVDNLLEYEYGVNEILSQDNFVEINLNKVDIKDSKDAQEKECLISDDFYCTKDSFGFLAHKNQIPYVNLGSLDTKDVKNIELSGRMHNINLLKDFLVMSLEDRETKKIYSEVQNYKTNEIKKNDNTNFPLYRMESDGNDFILTINRSFDTFILNIINNNINLTKIDIKGYENEPVSFIKVDDSKFLLHYGIENNALYLLSIEHDK